MYHVCSIIVLSLSCQDGVVPGTRIHRPLHRSRSAVGRHGCAFAAQGRRTAAARQRAGAATVGALARRIGTPFSVAPADGSKVCWLIEEIGFSPYSFQIKFPLFYHIRPLHVARLASWKSTLARIALLSTTRLNLLHYILDNPLFSTTLRFRRPLIEGGSIYSVLF